MLQQRMILAVIMTALLASVSPLSAQTRGEPDSQRPLVAVDVSLEVAAIERSMDEISTSFDEMSESLKQIAETGQLSRQQQEHLDSIMANLDHVTELSRRSVDALPSVVERSRAAVREGAEGLLADLKFWFIVVVVAVALLLVLALAAFYRFTLRPLQQTILQATSHISDMAQAMANTSKSLEIINETHREVLRLSGFQDGPPSPVATTKKESE